MMRLELKRPTWLDCNGKANPTRMNAIEKATTSKFSSTNHIPTTTNKVVSKSKPMILK